MLRQKAPRAQLHGSPCKRRHSSLLGPAVLAAGTLAALSSEANFLAAPQAPNRGSLQRLLAIGASPLLASAPAQAAEAETGSQLPLVVGGALVALAAVAAVLSSSDSGESVNDKKVVKEYFNNEGFERWQKIYGEKDDVNAVQKDIRVGHAETVDKILKWLDPATIAGKTVCDAGCGTGNLSIPLASRGAVVSGSDISSSMVGEAAERAKEKLSSEQMPKFMTSDLEALDGEYDTVCCVDVLIHYPPEKMAGMVKHLAGLSKDRVVLSFAPKTWYYVLLKRIGELFPGKSKTTRAYLHEEELVEAALNEAGYQVTRREMTATSFYFSRLLEAKPVRA
eukprot:TRINITY_DN8731_c0_g1_i2.p1 TRINITY_DN8731_c0_g1~~TRINITY_DN8731_c0_g1_i2.p1  ORF type:complete len:354 (-),score=75.81 TRINITY_DN8731_c0_g1_i2:66-1076(-)